MAKVILRPVGAPLDQFLGAQERAANESHMAGLGEALTAKREEVRAGWGPEYVKRVHEKGKLTTWERIEKLKDAGTSVLPVGTLVNYGLTFGSSKRTSPGAGVVTAYVQVHGHWTVVIANDNTVASGSWWPRTPEKIERAQEMALRLRVPVIYLVDCSGLYLPEQARTFPGKTGAGAIFRMNSLLSAGGVPQVAGVFGDCIAGGGYMPIISDVVYMTEQAYMVIAGAALIKGGKSQQVTSLDIGGPDVHVHISACADHRVPDDDACLTRIRSEIARLPGSAAPYYRRDAEAAPPAFPPAELDAVFPADHRMGYETRQMLARLLDAGLFWEVLPEAGREMVCGVGRIGGLYAGIIANNVMLTEHPEREGIRRPGGILYKQGIAKISAFSRACNDDGLPIVWLHDISGFDIGEDSTNQTPMVSVLLRKASGAGYYAMAGMPYDPVLQLSTPLTRLAVMEGRTLAIGTYRSRLDENFRITSQDAEEREKIEQGMKQVEARIEKDMDPVLSARQMDTDEVVLMPEIRSYLEAVVEMSYQTYGHRRVKNPRIWSLHDIAVITNP
jgi:acetyl-CoA carboxylase carboxyltransferase component